METIVKQLADSDRRAQAAMADLQGKLERKEAITMVLCACFLLAGSLGLGLISWLVTRRLNRIAREMDHVARLDFDRVTSGGGDERAAELEQAGAVARTSHIHE